MAMELEDIKFYGPLLYGNSSQSNQRVCILSRDIKSGTAGSAFDVENFLDTPTTLFAHTAISNPHPNGAKEDYKIVATAGQTLANGLTWD